MTRDFQLPEPPDDSTTVLGAVSRRLGLTQGQLYTVVLALLFVASLLLTGLPAAHRTTTGPPPALSEEVQP